MVNRLRQLKQLQGMDNRTARQDERMRYLQQNYAPQAGQPLQPASPQDAMRQPMPMPRGGMPFQPGGPGGLSGQGQLMDPGYAMPLRQMPGQGALSPDEYNRLLGQQGIRDTMYRVPPGGLDPGFQMQQGSPYQPAIDAGAKIATMPMSQNQGVTGSLTAAPGIERSGYDSGMRSPLQRSQGVSGFLTRAPGIERSGYDSGIMSPLQQSQGVSGFLTNAPGAERSGYRYNRGRGPLAIKR